MWRNRVKRNIKRSLITRKQRKVERAGSGIMFATTLNERFQIT